jgi:small subunit ribosomal protein S18
MRGMDGNTEEKRGFFRKKGCRFCGESGLIVDYKDKLLLKPFLTERFKIVPRRISGNCAKHQRELTVAIKRARHVSVIPYTTAQV